MCQEGPGDVKISDTAQAPEGPDDLLGKTHQSLESRGRRPTSSWPVWWGEAALGFGPLRQCLPAFSQRKSCYLHDPLGSQDWPEWQAWGSLATLVGHRLGDSSVPGAFPPHPTPPFFFSWRGKDRPPPLFSAELTASGSASKGLSFGSFPPAPSSPFSLLWGPQPVWASRGTP